MIDWTGERYVPWMPESEGHYEHLHRYRFAKEFVKGKKVLDLSCGEGYGSFMLAEESGEVIGIDIDENTIRHASMKYVKKNLEFIIGSMLDIPIKDGKMFDVIVCFEAIEHIEDHDGLMKEVKRLLKSDGVFVVSTPNKKYLLSNQPNYRSPFHLKELYFDEFRDLLSNEFKSILLYGQKVYPSSNIFPLYKESGPQKDFPIEKGDKEFLFASSDKKLAKFYIAVASDGSLDRNLVLGNSYLLDLSETLFRHKDAHISLLQDLVWKKEEALNDICNSPGWRIFLIYNKLRDKTFPVNTKRWFIANVILSVLIEPRGVFKKLSRLKNVFCCSATTKPFVLEKKIEENIPKVSQISDVTEVVEKFDEQYEEVLESTRLAVSTGLDRVKEPDEKSDMPMRIENIRVIAFYLPQYHPIPENDRWWGKGFTDWTNVVKAIPNFDGHYQPHLPADLGFYDLRVAEVREQQAEMAGEYGIYGYCYHHYWFNGRRLLERPFNEVLKTGRPDFPFCLCWANENWTRRWDGAEHEILIAQVHSKEDDIAFIRDIIPAFRDDRYIRVNGKPLLIVYRVNLLPNPKVTAEIWRVECKALGIGEIYLCAAQSFGITDPRPYGFDAAVEFPPHGVSFSEISEQVQITNPDFTGNIFGYKEVVQFEKKKKRPPYILFKTVMPSWDSTPRLQNTSNIFAHTTPDLYEEWLAHVIEYTNKNLFGDERLIFINAWNEWAEGAHLEPDRKHGDKFLKATKSVLEKFRTM
jgi:ubiquinone/menaquinone biosynthesis C-methylase UbiE